MKQKSFLGSFIRYALFVLILIPVFSWAQDIVTTAPSSDEITGLIKVLSSLGGAKGAAIVLAVVQALMLVSRLTFMDNILGAYKLLILTVLTVVSVVVAQIATGGLSVGSALISASALMAYQVLFNQVYKQFFVKTT